jgi:hypothetical protein
LADKKKKKKKNHVPPPWFPKFSVPKRAISAPNSAISRAFSRKKAFSRAFSAVSAAIFSRKSPFSGLGCEIFGFLAVFDRKMGCFRGIFVFNFRKIGVFIGVLWIIFL